MEDNEIIIEDEFTCFYDNYWNCLLPVAGSDSSAFLHMGIEFGSFSDGDKFRDAKLPDEWIKEESSAKHWFNILDDKKRIRIKVCQLSQKPFMYPERRFSTSKDEEKLAVIFNVWDNDYEAGQRVLIFKKRFVLPDKKRYNNAYSQKIAEYVKNCVGEKWLDETFPKWNSYLAYWGEGEIIIDPTTLKVVMKNDKDFEKIQKLIFKAYFRDQ